MSKTILQHAQILKNRLEGFWLARAVQSWLKADGPRLGAAISFYAMLSLAPLLVLVVAMLGWWLDRSVIEDNVIAQVQEITGARTAMLVQHALNSATAKSEGIIATIIATGVLLSAATGVFVALQDALKIIWGQPKDGPAPWWQTLVLRLRGVGYMLVFGGLLIASLVASTVLKFVAKWLHEYDHVSHPWLWSALNEAVSFVFITLLFCGMMRLSDGAKPRLRHLLAGSAIGAALFAVGRHFMTAYLSGAAAVSAYGAAGSLVALLMWLYFTSAILLLAASCAKTLDDDCSARQSAASKAETA